MFFPHHTSIIPPTIQDTSRRLSIDGYWNRSVPNLTAFEPMIDTLPRLQDHVFDHYLPDISENSKSHADSDINAALKSSNSTTSATFNRKYSNNPDTISNSNQSLGKLRGFESGQAKTKTESIEEYLSRLHFTQERTMSESENDSRGIDQEYQDIPVYPQSQSRVSLSLASISTGVNGDLSNLSDIDFEEAELPEDLNQTRQSYDRLHAFDKRNAYWADENDVTTRINRWLDPSDTVEEDFPQALTLDQTQDRSIKSDLGSMGHDFFDQRALRSQTPSCLQDPLVEESRHSDSDSMGDSHRENKYASLMVDDESNDKVDV